MDQLDIKILEKLRADARRSFRAIARDLGCSTVTVINRVRRMEEAGIIRAYRAHLDPAQLGYGMMAIIEVVANGQDVGNLEAQFQTHPNITHVFAVTGETDFILIGRFRSRGELRDFIRYYIDSKMVAKTTTHLVIDAHTKEFELGR
jgi:DNA-binding Lrp family transcriptional regulator